LGKKHEINMPFNVVEKIANRFRAETKTQPARCGDYIRLRPAHVMTHDNTGAVMPKFRQLGFDRLADPRQAVIALDHNVQDKGEKNLAKYAAIEAFAKQQGIDFFPAGRGIGHQIMCEEGYIWPGSLVVASDSHANMYGGLACLGTPVVRTDAAAIWARGTTWWQIPPVTRVYLHGQLAPGVSGKDIIITLAATLNRDEVLNHALEFSGPGVAHLRIDERLAIANMTTEWGALAGVFPCDAKTIAWLNARADFIAQRGPAGVASEKETEQHPRFNRNRLDRLADFRLEADADADYAQQIDVDLAGISAAVSGPNSVKRMTPAALLAREKIRIDKAYLLSCVNGRLEDFESAADVVGEQKFAPHVQFYMAAASSEVQAAAEASGAWEKLMLAGARPLPPGCGPCIGLGTGLLESGEVGISATNRNFKGRMGSPEAAAYLASPAVVAASAVSGYIDTPVKTSIQAAAIAIRPTSQKPGAGAALLLPGFARVIAAPAVFCPSDNLNTDGIYPGKYTYSDDMDAAAQAAVVMENYDPDFRRLAAAGDVLIGASNFGSGSSREQAATALQAFGIRLVIAASFSATYQRNAINNGFIAIAIPTFVDELRHLFSARQLTLRLPKPLRLDFAAAELRYDGKTYAFAPLGEAVQEIIIAGGLGDYVKRK
jgi:homoaconitate hydratase